MPVLPSSSYTEFSMTQPSQNPESAPNLPEQYDFPQLKEEHQPLAGEVYEPGAERQAEQNVETDVSDSQVQAPINDDTSDSTDLPKHVVVADIPDVADDIDVIEKAWVDRAKQIIKENKDDPRSQEEAFEQLQIEYHKKRYGRDIKAKR
ncbi:MAG: hypothetical protein WDZ32_01660 [Candidatus Saccharimonadales bacterium]